MSPHLSACSTPSTPQMWVSAPQAQSCSSQIQTSPRWTDTPPRTRRTVYYLWDRTKHFHTPSMSEQTHTQTDALLEVCVWLTWGGDVTQGSWQQSFTVGSPPAAIHVHVHTISHHQVVVVVRWVPVCVHGVAAVRPLVVDATLWGDSHRCVSQDGTSTVTQYLLTRKAVSAELVQQQLMCIIVYILHIFIHQCVSCFSLREWWLCLQLLTHQTHSHFSMCVTIRQHESKQQ